MPLTFDQFQNQIESVSGFTDWKYSGDDCDYPYYRAYRNNIQLPPVPTQQSVYAPTASTEGVKLP